MLKKEDFGHIFYDIKEKEDNFYIFIGFGKYPEGYGWGLFFDLKLGKEYYQNTVYEGWRGIL